MSVKDIWAVDLGREGDIQNALSIRCHSSQTAPVTEQVIGVDRLWWQRKRKEKAKEVGEWNERRKNEDSNKKTKITRHLINWFVCQIKVTFKRSRERGYTMEFFLDFLQLTSCCFKWMLWIYPKKWPAFFIKNERLLNIKTIKQGIHDSRNSMQYCYHMRWFLLLIPIFINYIEKKRVLKTCFQFGDLSIAQYFSQMKDCIGVHVKLA